MKKIWSALLALFIVFSLFGCKNIKSMKTPPPVNPKFEADAKVKYKDVNITCHVKQTGFNNSVISMSKPKELNGLKITKTPDECSLRFKNMNFNMDMSKFPKASFAEIMLKCYSSLVNKENLKVTRKDDIYVYEGSIDSGDFTIQQDAKTGNILKIEVPKAKLTCEFTNIKK